MYKLTLEDSDGTSRSISFNTKPFPAEISYAAQDLLSGRKPAALFLPKTKETSEAHSLN